MKRREFLMLAHTYKKQSIGGWFLSEKLDGMRAVWIPDTRGVKKEDIQWANHDKDSRYVTKPVATGLWSRYGNVIHAPDWWLDELPNLPLDGELYIRGFRQDLMKTVKKLKPGIGWKKVQYYVFDMPPYCELFKDGRLSAVNYTKIFEDIDYCREQLPNSRPNFRASYLLMKENVPQNKVVIIHKQTQLPYQTDVAELMLMAELEEITEKGGEGLILRSPSSKWEPKRSHNLLKVKRLQDSEAVVIGYRTGKETDKGSRHLGRMGSLIVSWEGIIFELSGFTDDEREIRVIAAGEPVGSAFDWAEENPGERCPDYIEATHFPLNAIVTFKYRDLTKDGIPQEARYWRKYEH